ncbi:hypothetical protein AB4Y90_00435 [Chryseobacterium sp. 2TAF14]|uniref:hypothetical protein n=1 Tax=Chryseobacterium sp. 2TAF14 TaxID=3233007 RepID=UPI003F8E0821
MQGSVIFKCGRFGKVGVPGLQPSFPPIVEFGSCGWEGIVPSHGFSGFVAPLLPGGSMGVVVARIWVKAYRY